MIKEINHLTFGMAVSGKNIKQIIFLQHQVCLFSQGDGQLQKNGIMQFLPKHMEADKISAKLQ